MTEELETLLNSDDYALIAQRTPHPDERRARCGETLWHYACWILQNAPDRSAMAAELVRRARMYA